MTSDVNGESPPQGHQSKDRRSSERIQTQRDVLFSDYEATGPLRVGMAVDMSAGGFKISSRYPEAVGTEIQIELQPQRGDQTEVVLFRGRVVHVDPLGNGDFAMGIKLLQRGSARTGGLSRGLLSLAAKATEANTQGAPTPKPQAAVAQSAQSPSAPRRVVFSKVEKRKPKRRKWLPWGALLVLFVVLCALFFEALRDDEERFPTGLFGAKFVSADSKSEQDLEPGLAKALAAGRFSQDFRATGPYERSSRKATDALLVRAQAALDRGDLDDAAKLFKQLEQHPEAYPIHRFVSLLGFAETAAARGDHSLARQTVRRALELGAGVPEPWRRAGRELAAKLNKNQSTPFEAASMDSVILIEPSPREDQAKEALRIEVDASEYLLSIVRGDVILRSFPIGLGFAGRTPIGEFQIANKISEADGYNRGDVVLAGAPDNPLGSSWTGLGDGTSPSSYGIHPMADTGSIGTSLSQGYVRMRPGDAETLFRLVPIGTRVLIRP